MTDLQTLETHSLVVRNNIQIRGDGGRVQTSILHLTRFAPDLAPGLKFAVCPFWLFHTACNLFAFTALLQRAVSAYFTAAMPVDACLQISAIPVMARDICGHLLLLCRPAGLVCDIGVARHAPHVQKSCSELSVIEISIIRTTGLCTAVRILTIR